MKDTVRSLAHAAERERRFGMLSLPHIKPLTDYVLDLRTRVLGDVPYFDPLDGGTAARVVFLLEKPGPKAAESGFISRNNDDWTAEYTFRFMQEAAIDRELTCLWNVVPGWNGSQKVKGSELEFGIQYLEQLLPLIPKASTLVWVGKRAQRAIPMLSRFGLRVLSSSHPSPKVRASMPSCWRSIPAEWARVHDHLSR